MHQVLDVLGDLACVELLVFLHHYVFVGLKLRDQKVCRHQQLLIFSLEVENGLLLKAKCLSSGGQFAIKSDIIVATLKFWEAFKEWLQLILRGLGAVAVNRRQYINENVCFLGKNDDVWFLECINSTNTIYIQGICTTYDSTIVDHVASENLPVTWLVVR